MKKLKCLRCETQMNYVLSEKIQLGQTSWVFGDLSNLLAGAIEVDVYSCPHCGKIEFFQTERESSEKLSQIKCPKCGRMHDFDYPKCPFCKHEY